MKLQVIFGVTTFICCIAVGSMQNLSKFKPTYAGIGEEVKVPCTS